MIYGVDGEAVEIDQYGSDFKFSMGVCVGIEDYEEFKESYKNALENSKESFDVDSDKKCLKSNEILEIISERSRSFELMREFITDLSEHIDNVVVVFSYFRNKNRIRSFERNNTSSELTIKKFHERHLGQGYEHLCAWKLLDDYDSEKIVCDAFNGYITLAWEELDKDKVSMVQKGDQVNPLLATSDIILSLLKEHFDNSNDSVYKNEITNFLENFSLDPEAEYLGNSLLKVMAPVENNHMPVNKITKKPLYTIIRPQTSSVGKDALLDSPNGVSLQNRVMEDHGSLKFYNEYEDKELLDSDSYVVYIDSDGEKDAETLKLSGYGIEALSFDDA